VLLQLLELRATWILNRSRMMLFGWANKMILLPKKKTSVNYFTTTLPLMMLFLFFFSFWAQSIYIKPCFLNPPNLMTPPPHMTHLQIPSSLLYNTCDCHSQKCQKLCGKPNIWLGSWGTFGVGEEWPRIPCPSSTFPTSFYTRHHKPYNSFCLLLSHSEEANSTHNPLKFSLHFISILSPNAKCI
jgi:hypothetical protein